MPAGRAVDLAETLKKLTQFARRNANSRVHHAQLYAFVRFTMLNQLDDERYMALLRELDCIVQQIEQNLADALIVS